MSKKMILGTVLTTLLTAGTAFADRPAPAAPAYGYGYGYGKAPAVHVVQRPHRLAHWTSLGEIRIGERRDRDGNALHVGRDDGRINQLRLVVKRGQAFLSGARITFGNGESMFVNLRGRIGRDGVAMIDIPGARFVRSIEIVPMFERRAWGARNRAVIEVLAQKAMTPPPWARL
jgi:hypothetical protein